MPPVAKRRTATDLDAIGRQIEEYLVRFRQPALCEPGEPAVPLIPTRFRLQPSPRGLLLEIWGESGNLVRRITEAVPAGKSTLHLHAARFGGSSVRLELIDLARPASIKTGGGVGYRAALSRMLSRRFPGWELRRLTAAPDLQRTLSGCYVRCELSRADSAWAVVAAPADASTEVCDDILTTGLLWLDELRSRAWSPIGRHGVGGRPLGLRVVLPCQRTDRTAERLSLLEATLGPYELWASNRRGELEQVDLADRGNIVVDLKPWTQAGEPIGATGRRMAEILSRYDAEAIPRRDGAWSLRLRGIEFGVVDGASMSFGLGRRVPVSAHNFPRLLELLDRIARARRPDAEDPQSPLYGQAPERWLESQLRRSIHRLDASLLPSPVYGQTPAVAGRAQGLLDLLAVDGDGRLVVLELKTGESPGLPLQALDYWARVESCRRDGRLQARNYFPGIPLAARPARVMLVAPALEFHPSTQQLLRFWPGDCRPECIGLNSDWRRSIDPVFRSALE